MKYINHITLNSGHCRKTHASEVDKDLYFMLRNLLKKSLEKDGTPMFDKYIVKSSKSDIGYLITLFGKHKSQLIPIVTTACSKNDTGELWTMLHTSSAVPLKTKANDNPPLPYIADRLEPGAILFLDVMEWTGDFSRCMGWICLAPEELR